jgi:hypothetical protein
MVLQERLRERGIGPTVYPTSAWRSTVEGWLAENGLGVGSYEYGWLLQNVLSMEVVLAGGERDLIEGETLRHFVGSRGSMGFFLRARLATRPVGGDVPVGVVFRDVEDLTAAVVDLHRGGAPLWHLGFLNAAMTRASGLEEGHVLFGSYPKERASWIEPALDRASESHRGRVVPRVEARHIWEQRFFPAFPLGPTPMPGRAFIRGAPWPDARGARARAGGGGDTGNGRPDGRGGASGFRPGQGERRTCRPVRHYGHRVGAASWPLLDARASVKGSGRGSRPRAWYEGTCRLRIQRLGGSRDD